MEAGARCGLQPANFSTLSPNLVANHLGARYHGGKEARRTDCAERALAAWPDDCGVAHELNNP